MKNSFETWLPKLVVAPAFVLGFAFIYGLMVWNGVLSFSASRMLPNYEWVGLAQYEKLWTMDRWWVALKNLGIFGVGYVGGSLAIGVLLAGTVPLLGIIVEQVQTRELKERFGI